MCNKYPKTLSKAAAGVLFVTALCCLFSVSLTLYASSDSPPEILGKGRIVAVNADCVSCHALDYGGNAVGAWYAPNITSDDISGVGGWSDEELAEYLTTGKAAGKSQAAGAMGTLVEHTLKVMPQEKVEALIVYLRTVPPVRDTADQSPGARPPFAYGTPTSLEPQVRGRDAQTAHQTMKTGAQLYSGYCASCHSPNGSGSEDQRYPSLYHNTVTGRANSNLVAAILFGVDRDAAGQYAFMPSFGVKSYVEPLTDKQIAAIARYVYTAFGNPAQANITAADVAVIRMRTSAGVWQGSFSD